MVDPYETRPRLLDLFCGAGGAAVGYHRAGFEVVGVDIKSQPRFPFEFHQADALTYSLDGFDVIHASPPCQRYSIAERIHGNKEKYPDLIAPIRSRLKENGSFYVIENVPGAPLHTPVMLCGLMFDLRILRHRYFETYPFFMVPGHPQHPDWIVIKSFRTYSCFKNGATHITMAGHNFSREDAISALNGDCSWMTREELSQAIPPAYTNFIGKRIMEALREADEKRPI